MWYRLAFLACRLCISLPSVYKVFSFEKVQITRSYFPSLSLSVQLGSAQVSYTGVIWANQLQSSAESCPSGLCVCAVLRLMHAMPCCRGSPSPPGPSVFRLLIIIIIIIIVQVSACRYR